MQREPPLAQAEGHAEKEPASWLLLFEGWNLFRARARLKQGTQFLQLFCRIVASDCTHEGHRISARMFYVLSQMYCPVPAGVHPLRERECALPGIYHSQLPDAQLLVCLTLLFLFVFCKSSVLHL